jgi:hypothetical protein
VTTANPNIPIYVVLAAHLVSASAHSPAVGASLKQWAKISKTPAGRRFCANRRCDHPFFATYTGIPVSTTHTITGAIVGVGSTSVFQRSNGA